MQNTKNNIGLVWFTNDLRIQDNAILKRAILENSSIIAVYCFDPRQYTESRFGFKKTERYRAQFLIETIANLRQNLKQHNIELFLYTKPPEDCIPELAHNHQVEHIYTQHHWTQEEIDVMSALKDNLPDNVHINTIYDQFLYHPKDIDLEISNIPRIFTTFRKHVEAKSYVRNAIEISGKSNLSNVVNDTKIPSLEDLDLESFEKHPNTAFPFKGGECAAHNRVHDYLFKSKKIGVYKKTRNGLIGKDFSSKFSPWLANGSISPRLIYWNVKQFEIQHFSNNSTYWLIFELIWRDYFKYISLKHQNAIFKIGGILEKDYQWSTHDTLVKTWINGRTSEPFVNANMIEFKKTGWMSNRGRQNVASYFAKELQLDWRIGAAYFESLLLDYDVHSNYGNWMYVAGVGNDPRDRKFNVKLQAQRYDTNGKYQQLWL